MAPKLITLLRTSQRGPYQRLTCRHLHTRLFTTNADDLWIPRTLRGSKASRRKPKLPVGFRGRQTPCLSQRLLFLFFSFRPDNRDTNEKQIIIFSIPPLQSDVLRAVGSAIKVSGGAPGAARLMCLISDHGARLMYSQHPPKQL